MANDNFIPYRFIPTFNTLSRLGKTMKRQKGGDEDVPEMSLTSLQYSRGLTNPTGENNCFVNSAVQALWHMDVFRKNFKRVDGHACMGDACIFCALKVLFTQFQYSEKDSLPPDALRRALAISFMKEKRFQLKSMDDAAECFENILLQVHFCLTDNIEENQCNVKHCIPHNKFAMSILTQSECECGATSEPFVYMEFVRYITSIALCTGVKNLANWRHSASFGDVLSLASKENKECPSKCGKMAELKSDLLNSPDVVTVGIIWDCDPNSHHISEVIKGIKGSLKIKDMYYKILESEAEERVYDLVGLIAYYGKHYCTFFYHSSLKQWLYLEDTTVKPLGPSWSTVADKCMKSHYQPSLLFYCNSNWSYIDTSAAPVETTLLPGYTITCKSPGAEKSEISSSASADYFPIKKIKEYEESKERGEEGSWTSPSKTREQQGVIEIGQAALGLIEEPSKLSRTEENDDWLSDRHNNNEQWPSASPDKSNPIVVKASPSGSSHVQSSMWPKCNDNQESTKSSSARLSSGGKNDSSGHYKRDSPQSGGRPENVAQSFSPQEWKKLYEKKKQEQAQCLKDPSTNSVSNQSKLNIKPLDSFDLSVFREEKAYAAEDQERRKDENGNGADQPQGLRSVSPLRGDYEDSGGSFLLQHNPAYSENFDSLGSFVKIPRGQVNSAVSSASGSRLPANSSSGFMTCGGNDRRDHGRHPTAFKDNSERIVPIARNPVHLSDSSHGNTLRTRSETPPETRFRSYQEDSWEELGPSIFVSYKEGGTSRDREVPSTEVKRTMSLEPTPRISYNTGKSGHGDDVARLWKEGKWFMEQSTKAELSGDIAVAAGNLSTAAYKLKTILKLPTLSSDEKAAFSKIYERTLIKLRELQDKFCQEDDDSCNHQSYSRSSSSGFEDDYERQRPPSFLQSAVDDMKKSLPIINGGPPSHHPISQTSHVPVTHWKNGPKVRQVPIVVEGRGTSSVHHHNSRSPRELNHVRDVPVREVNTLPRQQRSRPFVLTAANRIY